MALAITDGGQEIAWTLLDLPGRIQLQGAATAGLVAIEPPEGPSLLRLSVGEEFRSFRIVRAGDEVFVDPVE